MIARADTLFIASQFSRRTATTGATGIDVSHRGGLPGFALVAHETAAAGARLRRQPHVQHPGQHHAANPKCGLLFIDFDTGDTLQVTGEGRDSVGAVHHTRRFPRRQAGARVPGRGGTLHRAGPAASLGASRATPRSSTTLRSGRPDSSGRRAVLPPMRLLSVNVSDAEGHRACNGKAVRTGIFKEPAEGRVMLRRLNLDGDGQADLWGHGGAFQGGLCLLHRELRTGGRENWGATISPMASSARTSPSKACWRTRSASAMSFGSAAPWSRSAQPRVPCYKLAIKMGTRGVPEPIPRQAAGWGSISESSKRARSAPGDSIELVRS